MTSRTVVITGASKGIGRALSDRLAAEGHQVIGMARQESGIVAFAGGKSVPFTYSETDELAKVL